ALDPEALNWLSGKPTTLPACCSGKDTLYLSKSSEPLGTRLPMLPSPKSVLRECLPKKSRTLWPKAESILRYIALKTCQPSYQRDSFWRLFQNGKTPAMHFC